MSIKLKQENQHLWNRTIGLPFGLGETTISEDGFIEVETSEIAEQLAGANIGYEVVIVKASSDEVITIPNDKLEKIEPVGDIGSGNTVNTETVNTTVSTTVSNEDLIKGIDTLKVEELKKLAADSNLPKGEWGGLNKVALAEYLKSKLQ